MEEDCHQKLVRDFYSYRLRSLELCIYCVVYRRTVLKAAALNLFDPTATVTQQLLDMSVQHKLSSPKLTRVKACRIYVTECDKFPRVLVKTLLVFPRRDKVINKV